MALRAHLDSIERVSAAGRLRLGLAESDGGITADAPGTGGPACYPRTVAKPPRRGGRRACRAADARRGAGAVDRVELCQGGGRRAAGPGNRAGASGRRWVRCWQRRVPWASRWPCCHRRHRRARRAWSARASLNRGDAAGQLRSLVGHTISASPSHRSQPHRVLPDRSSISAARDCLQAATATQRYNRAVRWRFPGLYRWDRGASALHRDCAHRRRAGGQARRRYAAAASVLRPGEVLQCSALLGESVRQALPALGRLHVKIAREKRAAESLAGPSP